MVGRSRTLSLSIHWGSSSLARTPSTRSTVTAASIGPPGVLRKHSQTRPKDAHGQPKNTMDVEKQKEPPRRLSRRSPSTGANRWRLPSRKNSKQPEHDDHDEKDGDMRNKKDSDADSVKGSDDGRPMSMLEKQEQQQQLQSLSTLGASTSSLTRGGSTSLVPDPLPSYTDQLLQQIPGVLPPVRSHYPLNNPKGPKTYHNHHLIEPQTRMPVSSTFSPSFPPMRSTANGGAIVMDSLRIPMPGPSRSRSNSPVATPNASQTRLPDGLTQAAPGTRSRKVSQTAHDNVDMLDASDPWGQNWHHHSPYDVGLNNAPSQSPAQDPQIRSTGSRTSSTTKLNARPANPSPLSKSTSAVNLAEPSAVAFPPRTASSKGGTTGGIKRLVSTTSDEHSGPDPANHAKAHSAPVTPLANRERASPDKLEVPAENGHGMRRKLSKRGRMATAPPAVLATGSSLDSHEREVRSRPLLSGSTEKTTRRSSVLDKISKKISLLRNKPIGDPLKRNSSSSPTKEQNRPESTMYSDPRRLSKRVPPPSAQVHEEPGNRSSASIDIEMPLTMGPLTIANPDTPSSGTASPINIRSSLLHSQSSGQPELTGEIEGLRQDSESPVPPPKRPSPPLQVANPSEPEQHRSSSEHSPQHHSHELEEDIRSQPSHQRLRPDGIPVLPSLHLSPGRISLALSTTSSRPPPLPEKDKEWTFVNPTTLTDSPVEETPPVNSIPEVEPELVTSPPQSRLEVPSATVQRTASQQSLAHLAPPQAQPAAFSASADTAFSRLSTIVNPPTPLIYPSPIPSNSIALAEAMPSQPERVDAHRRVQSSDKVNLVVSNSTRPSAMRNSYVEDTVTSEADVKRESRREERPRHEERRERSSRHAEKSRHEERQSRADEGASSRTERHSRHEERKLEDRSRREDRPRRDSSDKEKEKDRLSRYEDKNRHEEQARRDSSEKERVVQERLRPDDVSKSVESYRSKGEDKQRQNSADRENPPRREKKRSTTEKFQLIRTPSDNIRLVSDTIPVGEEQWTLVETTTSNPRRERRERTRDDRDRERPRDGGDRDRDREHGRDKERDRASPEKGSSRRDSRRDDKYASVRSDPNHGHSSSIRQRDDRQRSTITRASNLLDQPMKPQRSPSADRNPAGSSFSLQTSSRTSPQIPDKDRPSDRRSRREDRPYASDPRSSYTEVNDTKSYQAGPSNGGRRSSNRRPTSEVPATAETINNITASEHWQADRLWKGQSAVIDHENRPYIPSTYDPRYSTFSINSTIGTYTPVDAMYGSNHTSYMVQSPYSSGAHPNSFYAIPVAPPPTMVYHSVAQPSPESYGYFQPYLAYNDNVPPFPVSDPQSPPNPLPEPPRQSVYSPEPLRQGRPGSLDDPSTPEYWSIYAGIPSH